MRGVPSAVPWDGGILRGCPYLCPSARLAPLSEWVSSVKSLLYKGDEWSIFSYTMEKAPARVIVSEDLRRRGFFVRDGLAYGSDWLLYPLHPSLCHAIALVFVFILPGSYSRISEQGDRAQETASRSAECLPFGVEQPERLGQKRAQASQRASGGALAAGASSLLPDLGGGAPGAAQGPVGGFKGVALPAAALVRMERLATSVGKKAILALVDSSRPRLPTYVQLSWISEGWTG